jgi:hypothetical protein
LALILAKIGVISEISRLAQKFIAWGIKKNFFCGFLTISLLFFDSLISAKDPYYFSF